MQAKSDIGLIGLAVMGENLVLNMESKGFRVSVFNRTVEKVDRFMDGRGKGKNIYGAHSLEDFVGSLKSPRRVFLMVNAGQAVDDFIMSNKAPLVSIGDLDNIIEHCGVDMTLRAVQQIVSMRKKKTFTLLISVDGSLLTQNVRNLLTGMMTEYRIE